MPWPRLAHLSLHKHGGGEPLAAPRSYNLRMAHLPPAHGSYMAYVQLTCAPSPLHYFSHHPPPLWIYMDTIYVSLSRRSGVHLILPEEKSTFHKGWGKRIYIYIYIYFDICIYKFIYTYIIYIYTIKDRIYIYINKFIYIYINIYIYIYITNNNKCSMHNIYIYIYIYIFIIERYTYMYIYIYVYIYDETCICEYNNVYMQVCF